MSTDNSVEIVENFAEYMNIKIVRLKQKRYNGGARNEGYLHLSDDVDYIWYVDSDDWLTNKRVLEKINGKLLYQPDVLFVGLSSWHDGIEQLYFLPEYRNKYDAMQGWSGSCGKVIKKELATRQECLYNEGTLKEDKNQHCKICIYMNDFEILQESVYVWNRSNNKSVTTIRTENPLWETSTIRNYADTRQLYLSVKGKNIVIDKILEERIEKTKQEILQEGDAQY